MSRTIPPKRIISTCDEFAAHWTAVNNAINPNITFSGGYGITSFNNDRTALVNHILTVVQKENAVQGSTATRDLQRAALLERMRQFNPLVRGVFPDSTYSRMLPAILPHDAKADIWMRALAEVANVWTLINAITPVPPGSIVPMTLAGGYTLAQFEADRVALLATFSTLDLALAERRAAIKARDSSWAAVYQRLRQYRLSVAGRLASDSALYQSLPKLVKRRAPKPKPMAEETVPTEEVAP